jgi:hypothetical protein
MTGVLTVAPASPKCFAPPVHRQVAEGGVALTPVRLHLAAVTAGPCWCIPLKLYRGGL